MELAQLDELLRRYRDAEQRIATSLVELEARPTYGLLRTTPWIGVTADRIAPALAAMPTLWRTFQAFRDLLSDATTRRGTDRRLDDVERQSLEVLLTGPSILLQVDQLPAHERTLLGPTERETWRTPEQVLAQMSADFALVSDAVGAVEAVWEALVPALDRANTALQAAGAGGAVDPAVATVREQVASVERALGENPLGLAPSTRDQLEAAVAIVHERRARQAGSATAWRAGLERADAVLARARADVAAARAAHGEAQHKIAAPNGLLDPPDDARIDAIVQQLAPLRAADDPSALARLDALLARAEDVAADAGAALTANRAPLDRRHELRGLLSAYQAKAGAAGLLEDTRITALVRAAEQELYRAPTDLDRAAQMVTELGAALRPPKGTP